MPMGSSSAGGKLAEPLLHEAGGEGADADEGGVAKARIAREAAQDRPGDGKSGRIEHELA